MANRKCEKCGCDTFGILAVCEDLAVCLCNIDDNGTIEYLSDDTEEVLSTTYANQAKCDECGHITLVDPSFPVKLKEAVIVAARHDYVDDDIVMTDEPIVEKVEGGYWVSAQVWISQGLIDARLTEEAYRIYEKSGQYAVYDFARDYGVQDWSRCEPCEDETPTVDGVCLVCGTPKERAAA